MRAAPPELSVRTLLSPAATQPLTCPFDSCAACALSALQYQASPPALCTSMVLMFPVPCKHHIISCAILSHTALWELILGSSFVPAQGDPSVTSSSAPQSAQLPLQVPGQSLLTTATSTEPHTHRVRQLLHLLIEDVFSLLPTVVIHLRNPSPEVTWSKGIPAS